jgi:hypothetical protein
MVFPAVQRRLYQLHGRLNNLQISKEPALNLSKRGNCHCRSIKRSHELLVCLYSLSFDVNMSPGSLNGLLSK